jgi:diguanylate cyclase (GGDEF)-like protein
VALGRPDQLADLYSQYAVPGDRGTGFSAENWCVMPKLGNHLYLAIDAGPIHDEDGNLIAVVRDMTDQKRAEMALQTLAAKDGLTGLANRRCFDQVLQAERLRAQRAGKPMALLFVDVDHVKPLNDRHGHQSGDECLRAIAAIVGAHASRPVDLAARYGGEEFAIILPATDRDGACKVAEQIRKRCDGVADRAPRFRGRRACDAQCRRGDARSPQRCRRGPAARTGGSGALCRQAPRPKPRRLRRHHAGRFRQAQPAQHRGAICTAQGAAIMLKQNYRTSASFFDCSTRSADPIAWAAAGL